jgi:hypothetical protein
MRALRTLLLCLAALVALPVAAATAATYPKVKKIAPMQAAVGQTLTITGSGFLPGRSKNTVVFKRDGRPAVFVKAATATRTKLTVVLPAKLDRFLAAAPVRFRVRILARRFGRSFTPLAASPRLGRATTPLPTTPAPTPPPAALTDCDLDGTPDGADAHDDQDQLPDTLEAQLGTDRCLSDTDGDAMQDGWEYRSAVDLNRESCPAVEYPTPCEPVRPYPRKRPYPNPLDPADAGIDFDGDFLTSSLEHAAWLRRADRNLTALWYSDGLQASQDANPADGCRGTVVPAPLGGLFPLAPSSVPFYTLDLNLNGCLDDRERDEDGDHLTNFTETRGILSGPSWVEDRYKEPAFPVVYAGTNWLDEDSDGDGVVDGFDDQDFDDFWNVEEQYRGTRSSKEPDPEETAPPAGAEKLPWRDTGVRTGLWVAPFNPCLPSPRSRTCPQAREFDSKVYMPFLAPDTTRTGWPIQRWPLYGEPFFAGYVSGVEQWVSPGYAQTMPPAHPIPRSGPR